ncbi:rootletin-like, partial [Carcharodon carcharias]|uniref:rootletin-like n=1 Tax=Carcharodon carcharias TaxID=13397 RepID=UPI001B7F7071
MARLTSTLQAACMGLVGSMRVAETGNSLSRAREQARVESLDKEVRERTQEVFQLQVRFQAERAELNARISELSLSVALLDGQIAEKDRTIRSLSERGEELESLHHLDSERLSEFETVRRTIEDLQSSLQEIAEVVMLETNGALVPPSPSDRDTDPACPRGTQSVSPSRRLASPSRGLSPSRPLPAGVTISTLDAIRSGLRKKQLFIQDLQGKMQLARESAGSMRKQLMDCEGHRQALEGQLQAAREENRGLQRGQSVSERELEELRQQKESLNR